MDMSRPSYQHATKKKSDLQRLTSSSAKINKEKVQKNVKTLRIDNEEQSDLGKSTVPTSNGDPMLVYESPY
ncbi:hypothetical protein E2C01_090346 [Portunus trituberculatus]|uniref:Uncharacterized protein n=1 Tax=Portunus trituberculatus TaxID=210409 RepID=A0A5B7JK04_PORTR|nr:hypothetical protein [Portunus trituberculatus]